MLDTRLVDAGQTTARNGAGSRAAGDVAITDDDEVARDVATFLERFFRFGAAPCVETYMPLFHPDATLFDDGMERPITVPEIPASITATLALAQGFVMVPERWRVRDRSVFVEARNEATVFGVAAEWRSVYRIDLDGDLVHRGRRYYDRAPLLAALDPSTPALPSLAPDAPPAASPAGPSCAAAGVTPEELIDVCQRGFRGAACHEIAGLFRDDAVLIAPALPRPLGRDDVAAHRRALAGLMRGAPVRLRAWAGDDTLVMLEWECDVPTSSGGTYLLGMVDRFDLVDGRILSARTYFDAAALARALLPPIA